MQPDSLGQILDALTASQELIEKCSFDSINQQDKVAKSISELMITCNTITMKLDSITMQVEDLIEKQKQANSDDRVLMDVLSKLQEQNSLQIEASQRIQILMDEQSKESDIIHDMEMQIADHREILNEACYIKE